MVADWDECTAEDHSNAGSVVCKSVLIYTGLVVSDDSESVEWAT